MCESAARKKCLEGEEENEMIKKEYTNPYTGRCILRFRRLLILQSMSHKFIWKCFLYIRVRVTIHYQPKPRYEAWEPKEVSKTSECKIGALENIGFSSRNELKQTTKRRSNMCFWISLLNLFIHLLNCNTTLYVSRIFKC